MLFTVKFISLHKLNSFRVVYFFKWDLLIFSLWFYSKQKIVLSVLRITTLVILGHNLIMHLLYNFENGWKVSVIEKLKRLKSFWWIWWYIWRAWVFYSLKILLCKDVTWLLQGSLHDYRVHFPLKWSLINL